MYLPLECTTPNTECPVNLGKYLDIYFETTRIWFSDAFSFPNSIFYNLSFLGFKIWNVEKYIVDIFFERTYLKKAEFSNLLSYFFFFLMSEFSAALFKCQLLSEYFDFCNLAKRIEPVGFSNEIKLWDWLLSNQFC